jgi:hypothetical protein
VARVARWPQEELVLGQSVVQDMGRLQLGQAALDHNVTENIFVDSHLRVEFTEGFWAERKIQLPDLGLQ